MNSHTDELLKEAVRFHGHMGPFLVLGFKMGLLAKKILNCDPFTVTAEIHTGKRPKRIEEVRDALIRVEPENTDYFNENAQRAIGEIEDVAETVQEEAQTLDVRGTKVICMEWQKAFVEWMGFTVVASYPSPETLSVKDVHDLVTKGRNEGVVLIIDSLQSGTEVGSQIAEETAAYHVVLIKFSWCSTGNRYAGCHDQVQCEAVIRCSGKIW